jgi:hypothetical protein
MESVTLTKVFRNDKDKMGAPLMTKAGKPYTKLAIKTDKHGDQWLSGFGNSRNEKWAEGSKVDIMVSSTQGNDGKTYLNFETPKPEDMLATRVSALELDVINLKKALMSMPKVGATPSPAPEYSEADMAETLDDVFGPDTH